MKRDEKLKSGSAAAAPERLSPSLGAGLKFAYVSYRDPSGMHPTWRSCRTAGKETGKPHCTVSSARRPTKVLSLLSTSVLNETTLSRRHSGFSSS